MNLVFKTCNPQRSEEVTKKLKISLNYLKIYNQLKIKIYQAATSNVLIRTRFGKTIPFNCPLKLCNNFISFREQEVYFSK